MNYWNNKIKLLINENNIDPSIERNNIWMQINIRCYEMFCNIALITVHEMYVNPFWDWVVDACNLFVMSWAHASTIETVHLG